MFTSTAQILIAVFYSAYLLFVIGFMLTNKQGYLRFCQWFSIDILTNPQFATPKKMIATYLLRNSFGFAAFITGIYFEPMFTIVVMIVSTLVGMMAMRLIYGKGITAQILAGN